MQRLQEGSYTGKTTVYNIFESKLMNYANSSDGMVAYQCEM